MTNSNNHVCSIMKVIIILLLCNCEYIKPHTQSIYSYNNDDFSCINRVKYLVITGYDKLHPSTFLF